MDIYQDRYLEHQQRKKQSIEDFKGEEPKKYNLIEKMSLIEVIKNRRSQRIFNDEDIIQEEIDNILFGINESPSSCNRQAIYLKEIDKNVAETFLVGGKNWINKAKKVYLIFADKEAYKSPNEIAFMPYLDAGFVVQNIYLICEINNIGCCFVNPNIKIEHKEAFTGLYGNDYLCGAVALGKYDNKSIRPPKRDVGEVLR